MRPFPGNLHTHTQFCDGQDTMEAMVRAAFEAGLTVLGFSPHGPAPYDDVAMAPEHMGGYLAEAARLRGIYRDRMDIYTGLEWDGLSGLDRTGLDYVIGSVHYVRDEQGVCRCLDDTPEQFQQAAAAFGGAKELIWAYVDTYRTMLSRGRPEVAGHLDILTKLNSDNRFFDPASPWYREAQQALAQAVEEAGCVVEINTAGIDRTGQPWPGGWLLERLIARGVPLTLSADAHRAEDITRHFDRLTPRLAGLGLKELWLLGPRGFEPWPLA